MIKNDKELFITSFLASTATLISVALTTLLFMTFATTSFEKVLYFSAGIVNDGAKAFCLTVLIKYIRAKLYRQASFYGVLFTIFGLISLFASVSFTMYTAKTKMYKEVLIVNTSIATLENNIEKLENEILKLEHEKQTELERTNKVIDSLPANQITNRNTYNEQKKATMSLYDTKINVLKPVLADAQAKLDATDKTPKKIMELQNTPLAGLFDTMAKTFKINIDTIITVFAVFIGIAMDLCMIAFSYDKAMSYKSATEKKLAEKKLETVHNKNVTVKTEKKKISKIIIEANEITSYSDFVAYVEDNNLNPMSLRYSDFKGTIKEQSFYKWKKDLLKANII